MTNVCRLFCATRFPFRNSTLQLFGLKLRYVSTVVSQHRLQENIASGKIRVPHTPEIRQRPGLPHGRAHHLNVATREIQSLTRSGQYESAWQLFSETSTSERDAYLYSAVLSLCGRAFWRERALKLWSEISANDKDVVCYAAMFDVCARCKFEREAGKIFEELKASDVTPNIVCYNSLLKVYASSNHPEKGLEIFNSIPNDLFTSTSEEGKQMTFSIVMSGFARSGDYVKTRDLFVQMTNQGIKPDNRHYNALITACASTPIPDIAQAVFDQMIQVGLIPDASDWTILASCHRNDLSKSKAIFQQMQEAGIQPSSFTYQTLLEAHLLAKDATGAQELLSSPEKFGSLWNLLKMVKMREEISRLGLS